MVGRRESPEGRGEASVGRPGNKPTLGKKDLVVATIAAILGALSAVASTGVFMSSEGKPGEKQRKTHAACAELVSTLGGMELEDSDRQQLCTNALIQECLDRADLDRKDIYSGSTYWEDFCKEKEEE